MSDPITPEEPQSLPPVEPPPPISVEPFAVTSLYTQVTAGTTPAWCGTYSTSAGTNALAAWGWQVGKTATSTPFMRGFCGASGTSSASAAASSLASATGPRLGTGSGATTASDFIRSNTTLLGNFPAGNWTFNFYMRTSVASTQAGRMRFRVWAAKDPTGQADDRELSSGVLVASTIALAATGTNYNSTYTWAAPALQLRDEYLFIQVEWEITTAGGSNTANVLFYSISTPAQIITTNATTLGYGTLADTEDPDIANFAGQLSVIGSLSDQEDPDIASFAGDVITVVEPEGALDADEAPDAVSFQSIFDTKCVLLQHYDGTFDDTSGYAHPFTPAGGAATSGAQSKFGAGSLYLGNVGTPRTITTPDAPELRFQGDFTLDFWIWLTSNPAATTEFLVKNGTEITFYSPVYVEANSGGGVDVYMSSNGTSWDIMTSLYSGTFSNNAWHHIALVRSGNDFTIYRDGTSAATVSSALQPVQSGDPLIIGTQFAAVDGYIEELRLSTIARWTANFTPPTQPYGPISGSEAATETGDVSAFPGTVAWTPVSGTLSVAEVGDTASHTGSVASQTTLTATETADTAAYVGTVGSVVSGALVVSEAPDTGFTLGNTPQPDFLLHAEAFSDSSGNNHTVNANGTTISTAQKQFGASSFLISNSNVYLDGAANMSIGSADNFTIDFWVYPTVTNSVHPMSAWYDGATDNLDICIRGGGCLQVFDHGGLVIVGGTAFTLNGWNHVALTRQGGSLRGFLNGVLQGTNNSNTQSYPVSGQSPSFGRGVVGGTQQYAGYMDEIRFVKGQAVWTANFTPPSVPYALDGGGFPGNIVWLTSLASSEAPDTASFAGLVGLTGVLSVTEAPNTAAFTGSTQWQTSFALIETPDTAAFPGQAGLIGTLAVTETGDTAVFPGAVMFPVTGTLVVTEAGDSAAWSGGGVWQGTLAATESSDLSALSGAVYWTGTLAATEAQDTVLYSASVSWQGTLAAAEALDTATFPGRVGLIGGMAATDPADTSAFSGQAFWQTSLNATEASDTPAFAGTVRWQTALTASETADTAAVAGAVLSPIPGTLAAIETGDLCGFNGGGVIGVVLAATEARDVAAYAGGVRIDGTLNAAGPTDLAAFTGQLVTFVALSAQEAPNTASLAGLTGLLGSFSAQESQDTAAHTGLSGLIGSITGHDSPDTAQLSGGIVSYAILDAVEAEDRAIIRGSIGFGTIGVPGPIPPVQPPHRIGLPDDNRVLYADPGGRSMSGPVNNGRVVSNGPGTGRVVTPGSIRRVA